MAIDVLSLAPRSHAPGPNGLWRNWSGSVVCRPATFVEPTDAALALLPLDLKGDVPGNEIERPMALVILGGHVTSTLLNLFLLPSLYARFGGRTR